MFFTLSTSSFVMLLTWSFKLYLTCIINVVIIVVVVCHSDLGYDPGVRNDPDGYSYRLRTMLAWLEHDFLKLSMICILNAPGHDGQDVSCKILLSFYWLETEIMEYIIIIFLSDNPLISKSQKAVSVYLWSKQVLHFQKDNLKRHLKKTI